MTYKYLLAKRSKTPDAPLLSETLKGHILEVAQVADVVARSWGAIFLQAMGLPQEWGKQLLFALLRGAFLHDLGKSNDHFQRIVRYGPDPPQAIRHELISLYIILRCQGVDRWLFPREDKVIRQAALFAVVGHHLKFQDANDLIPRGGSGDSYIKIFTSHPDFTVLLQQASTFLGLANSPPHLSDLIIDLLSDDPLPELLPWLRTAKDWWEKEASSDEKLFVSLVKALVTTADVAGSALPKTDNDAVAWVEKVLSRTCQSEDLERLATRGLNGKPLRKFQTDVAESLSPITLVRAGCGSGKTTAAYLWGARNANGRKLFFCYPTTGTATEGYADYALSDDIDSALIHSRAEVDLEDLQETPDCPEDNREVRIKALEAWDVPLIVCTADTVLGLMQNNRNGLFSFPAIANGALVFDEIHAYDDRMFGSLLHFLKAFPGTPVLLMTASLPKDRVEALRNFAKENEQPLKEVEGSIELEKIPRYLLEDAAIEEVWAKIEQTLSSAGKVLWVVNTVDRALERGKEAEGRGLTPVLPYHSRYRYCDRIEKHRAVIKAFDKKESGPVLAITTQVCEVSLNLSADLLVTDLAPIPSLIQRLGRLNRRITVEEPGHPQTALVLEPEKSSPYDKADLENARKWLDKLGGRPVSQADLSRSFLDVITGKQDSDSVSSAWLDGGPFSAPAPLRETGMTIPVIRSEDAPPVKQNRSQVLRLAIPMLLGPVANEINTWQRFGVALIAPRGRIEYSEKWGASWQK